jgi:hypothetical protein
MRLRQIAVALAFAGVLGLLATPADAAAKKKRVVIVNGRGQTVFVSRDENGRARTRILVQKRSFLDPGTETFPGERQGLGYVEMAGQRASSVLDNTVFGTNQTALPGPFDLPSRNNPWLQY